MRHDLLVVGGGIQGAAVARDAALRGLKVLLLERGDLASGTSSRSSKLIHGGIRYLETGQVHLVREALHERALLLELAPDHVRPLPFLIPHYRGRGRSRHLIRAGLALYAAFAGRHPLAAHRTLSAAEALDLEPTLERTGLDSASLYWDAQMDDAAMCVSVALDAERAGAAVRTYTSLVGLAADGSAWRARFRDVDTGAEEEALARCVVNAGGPWADEVHALAFPSARAGMRRTRGTHIVTQALTRKHALLLTAERDGRVLFVLPWGAYSLIGTTDVDDDTPPARVTPRSEDVRYLLEGPSKALPGLDPARKPLRAFAGLRSLVRSRAATPWGNTREHRIVEQGTLLTLLGGKYTTHRSFAEHVVDRAAGLVGIRAPKSVTAATPLRDGRTDACAKLRAAHPALLSVGAGIEIAEAAVVHAVRAEHARRLEDVLLRRTRLWLDRDAIGRAAAPVAEWMAPHLGWDDAARGREVRAVRDMLAEEDRIIEAALAIGGKGP